MKKIFTLITPEGKELIIGVYTDEGHAKAVAKKKFPSDWLSLCAYPLEQREVRPDEIITPWSTWSGT